MLAAQCICACPNRRNSGTQSSCKVPQATKMVFFTMHPTEEAGSGAVRLCDCPRTWHTSQSTCGSSLPCSWRSPPCSAWAMATTQASATATNTTVRETIFDKFRKCAKSKLLSERLALTGTQKVPPARSARAFAPAFRLGWFAVTISEV